MRALLIGLTVLASLGNGSPAVAQGPPPASQPSPETGPIDYRDDKSWLCRPGRKGDACDIDLTTTVIAADGTLTR